MLNRLTLSLLLYTPQYGACDWLTDWPVELWLVVLLSLVIGWFNYLFIRSLTDKLILSVQSLITCTCWHAYSHLEGHTEVIWMTFYHVISCMSQAVMRRVHCVLEKSLNSVSIRVVKKLIWLLMFSLLPTSIAYFIGVKFHAWRWRVRCGFLTIVYQCQCYCYQGLLIVYPSLLMVQLGHSEFSGIVADFY